MGTNVGVPEGNSVGESVGVTEGSTVGVAVGDLVGLGVDMSGAFGKVRISDHHHIRKFWTCRYRQWVCGVFLSSARIERQNNS